MIRVLDLFSGIGGISLGLERSGGFETIAFCEIDPFCRRVLHHHWPEVPIHDDIRIMSTHSMGRIDAVVGGFPCQDISSAGKGLGIEKGERSGLWREMFRIIDECRPRWVLVENVSALRTRGADRVLGDLEGIGYTCWPLVVGARHVGAPHRRDRVWIVAHRDGDGLCRSGREERISEEAGIADTSGNVADGRRPGVVLDDSQRAGLEGHRSGARRTQVAEPRDASLEDAAIERLASVREAHERIARSASPSRASARGRWPARPGEPQHDWEEPRLLELADGSKSRQLRAAEYAQCQVGPSVDGIPERLVRRWNRNALKAAGNSVVPRVVEMIGRAILEVERRHDAQSRTED